MDESNIINFEVKVELYGNPVQSWKVNEKIIWMLWILSKCTSTSEYTVQQLTNTYNSKYRQFGTLLPNHVSNALNNVLKTDNPPLVDNVKKAGSEFWFLTNAGIIKGDEQIAKNKK